MFLDLERGNIRATIPVVPSPRSLVLSRDGERLFVAGFDGGISIVETRFARVAETVSAGNASIFRLTLSPDGKTLYATDRANSRIFLFDSESGKLGLQFSTGGRESRDLALSEDGRTLYVANQESNSLVLFEAQTGRRLQTIEIGDGPRGFVIRARPVAAQEPLAEASAADFDSSGRVDFSDFVLFAKAYGLRSIDPGYEVRFDLNDDGQVDFGDFILFAGAFGLLVSA